MENDNLDQDSQTDQFIRSYIDHQNTTEWQHDHIAQEFVDDTWEFRHLRCGKLMNMDFKEKQFYLNCPSCKTGWKRWRKHVPPPSTE